MSNNKVLRVIFCTFSIVILGIGLFLPSSDLRFVILGIGTLFVLILMDLFMDRIAGLSKDNPKVKTMRRLNYLIMLLVVLFFGIVQWVPAVKNLILKEEEIFSLVFVAVLMVVIGNAAPKLPFNRYMGLRLPWTVRDEMTWKVAHKLLGYITFPLVILMVIGGSIGKTEDFIKFCVLAWAIIPGLYSGWYYYQRMNGKQ